ncbi:hypothetical protein GTO89_07600 [Heliobacterium gestii]|uniref:Uncharacterized protein n=1 Tax=Heliomicrobium gestii TaxID=2699 RepID=A0A845LHF7_HELGE|nr:hypothetical protein [Heliomicrobium gestii]MBM7866308.1 hypothetical protein [Heliomicrobium gestii]MZP42903.1 hypothetical protein [Heliomicrobium gestii]
MSDNHPNRPTTHSDIKPFVRDCLRRSGAVLEESGYELWEVLLSDDLSRRCQEEHLCLTFDAEVARETPDALFVTYGSPFLDAVVEQAKVYGDYTQFYWPGTSAQPPQNLLKKIHDQIQFQRCRPPSVEMVWTAEHRFYAFFFLCTFQSFEKTEVLLPVVIDGFRGERRDDFFQWWDTLLPADKPAYSYTPAPSVSPEAAYRAACSLAEQDAKERAQAIYDRSAAFRRRELSKIAAYYMETEAALRKKLEAADTAEKQSRLTAQIEATRADQERRLIDAQDRYRVKGDVRLDHVMMLSLPRIHVKLSLQLGKQALQPVVLYNPVNGQVEPLRCERCGKPVTVVSPDKEGRLVCGQGC